MGFAGRIVLVVLHILAGLDSLHTEVVAVNKMLSRYSRIAGVERILRMGGLQLVLQL